MCSARFPSSRTIGNRPVRSHRRDHQQNYGNGWKAVAEAPEGARVSTNEEDEPPLSAPEVKSAASEEEHEHDDNEQCVGVH